MYWLCILPLDIRRRCVLSSYALFDRLGCRIPLGVLEKRFVHRPGVYHVHDADDEITDHSLAAFVLAHVRRKWMERNKQVTTWLTTHSLALRWSAYYALIIWVLAFGYYAQRTFIYFQF